MPDDGGPPTTRGVRPAGGLARKAVDTLALRLIGLPIAFATTVVTSRVLLPEGRGAYVIGLVSVTLVATLLANGTAVTHEVGRRSDEISAILVEGLILSLVIGCIVGAALVPVTGALVDGDYDSVRLFALGLPGLLVIETLGGAFLATGRVRAWGSLQVVSPALILSGTILLVVVFDLGVTGAVIAWVVAQTGVAVLALAMSLEPLSRGGFRGASPRYLPRMARLAVMAGLVNLVAIVNYRVALFVIEHFEGLEGVGIYSVAMSIAELLWLLSSTLTTVVVAPAIHRHEAEAVSIVSVATRQALLLTTGAGITLALLGWLAIPFVFGQEFEPAVAPLLLLIPGVIVYAPSSVLSAYFSLRHGRMRYPLTAAGSSAAVGALGCVILVPALGVPGAGLATAIGFATGAILLLWAFVRATRVPTRSLLPRRSDVAAYRSLAGVILRGR